MHSIECYSGQWWVGKAVEESGRGLFWSIIRLLRWRNWGSPPKTLVTIATGSEYEPRNSIAGSTTTEHFTATYSIIGSVHQWVFSMSSNTKLPCDLMSEKHHSDIFTVPPLSQTPPTAFQVDICEDISSPKSRIMARWRYWLWSLQFTLAMVWDGQSDYPLFVVSKRYTPRKNKLGWSTLAFCACEIIG